MKEIPNDRLEEVLSGRMLNDAREGYIDGAVIQSQLAGPHKLFIPVTGERYDAHLFIKDALDHGAGAIVSQEPPEELGIDLDELTERGIPFILTSSTVRALRRLSAFNRDRTGIPIIAVTGSSGKTTTKDLISTVLGVKYNVLKTEGNLNNIFGVPRTILDIEPEHDIAVVEMGMSSLGEIDSSIRFVRPQIAVITNIGTAHLESLGSRENILKAKKEILATLTDKDTAILNGDDELLNTIEPSPFKIMRYGIHNHGLNLKATNCVSDNGGVTFNIGDETYHLRFPGEHNIYNALCAVGIAKMFGLEPDEIQRGLDAFEPSDHRLNILENKGYMIIDDSYNANPDSMRAALRTLRAYAKDGGRCIAVLGDMFELGDSSLGAHLEVGREAAKQADYLIGVGEMARNIIRGAIEVRAGMRGQYFTNHEETAEFLKDFLRPGDMVLFKASRGMHFEDIIKTLVEDQDE